MHLTDIATLRARAGYDAGQLLPYFMIGAAFGRADIVRTATAAGFQNPTTPPTPCDSSAVPPCTPFFFTESAAKTGAFIYGWSLGTGIDVMLMPRLFLRAEYEYVAFAPIWTIKTNVQTARLGLGFKF